jgi:hypothetical protein
MQSFVLDLESGDCVPTTKERVDALEKAIGALNPAPPTQTPTSTTIRSWLRHERSWVVPSVIAVAVVVILASFGVAYYVAGLEIDNAGLNPPAEAGPLSVD